MTRRSFSREFNVEAVRLIRERGVTVAQAARDLDVHENLLRKWAKDFADDPRETFPGHGRMNAAEAEVAQLKREVQKLKAERAILQKAAAYFARTRRDVRVHCEAPGDLAARDDL